MPRPVRALVPRLASLLAATGVLLLLAPRMSRAQTDTARATADSAGLKVHMRILGVFDEQTGDPIEGADVTDLITGLTTRTTATGTVPIFYTDGPGTLVKIKKVGYQQALVPVRTSVADTTPMTTTLLQMGQRLAPVIVVGDRAIWLSKSDTIRELLRNGFYERRETSAAPRSAFISGDKMRGAALVSDARFFGRGICESNVYIDGVRVAVPTRSGHFQHEGLDALVSPFDVAGIETYTTGEMPTGAAHTTEGAGTFSAATAGAAAMANAAGTLASTGCVTFIWLTR